MHIQRKELILLTCTALILASCGPKKEDETTPPATIQEAPVPQITQPLTPLQPPPQKKQPRKLNTSTKTRT